MNPLLWMVVMFGLVGPFCCFIVGFPFWINLLLSLLGLVLGEQTMAKSRTWLQAQSGSTQMIPGHSKHN